MNATQDLALVSALELASKKKIKRKIGAVADSPEAVADAAHFLELAKTAAQTLKAVCTLYEWRDPYVAAAAAAWPPRKSRKPDGAPGSDTLLDAVVNGAFVALRRATPRPGVGIVKSVAEVAPARRSSPAPRAWRASAPRAAPGGGRGQAEAGALRLGLAAVRLAAAAPADIAPALARAAAEAARAEAARLGAAAAAAGGGWRQRHRRRRRRARRRGTPPRTRAPSRRRSRPSRPRRTSREARWRRATLLPVAATRLGLLQTLLDLETELPGGSSFSFLDAAAEDDLEDGCEPLLAAAVGAVLRACAEAMDAQTDAAGEGWLGQQGGGWVLEKPGATGAELSESEKAAGRAAAPPRRTAARRRAAAADLRDPRARGDGRVHGPDGGRRRARRRGEGGEGGGRARGAVRRGGGGDEARAGEVAAAPPPLGRGSGALCSPPCAVRRRSPWTPRRVATTEALAAPRARPGAPRARLCAMVVRRRRGGFAHQDDGDVTTAAAAAARTPRGAPAARRRRGRLRGSRMPHPGARARGTRCEGHLADRGARAAAAPPARQPAHPRCARRGEGRNRPRGGSSHCSWRRSEGAPGTPPRPAVVSGGRLGSEARVREPGALPRTCARSRRAPWPRHDVAIVQTLVDELKCRLPGGGDGGGGGRRRRRGGGGGGGASGARGRRAHRGDALSERRRFPIRDRR